MKGITFSVVIPVYNAEKYLANSLKELRKFIEEGVQFIFVDDGSTDGSSGLLSGFCEHNSSCTLIKRRHEGVSAARNAGLLNAQGEYILFLDIDDCYEQSIFEVLSSSLEKSNADILVFGAHVFNYTENYKLKDITPRNILYREFQPDALFIEEGSFPYVWNSAYKRKFLLENSLLFKQNLCVGEDLVFQFCAFPRAKVIQFISDKLYCYHYMKYSSVMHMYDKDITLLFAQHIKIVQAVLEEWKKQGYYEPLKAQFFLWMHGFLYSDLMRLPCKEYVKGAKQLRKMLKEQGISTIGMPVFWKKKISFFCLTHSFLGYFYRLIKNVRKSCNADK